MCFRDFHLDHRDFDVEGAGRLQALQDGDDLAGRSADFLQAAHELFDSGAVFELDELGVVFLYADADGGGDDGLAVGERLRLRDVEAGRDLDGEAAVEDRHGRDAGVFAEDDCSGAFVDDEALAAV